MLCNALQRPCPCIQTFPTQTSPPARRYLVSQHPEVEAKLAAELDEAGLLVTPERPQPRALAHADLARLTYLNCVLKVRFVGLYPDWLRWGLHACPACTSTGLVNAGHGSAHPWITCWMLQSCPTHQPAKRASSAG